MSLVEDVRKYVDEFILHSRLFDDATEEEQRKAVNQSNETLKEHLSEEPSVKDIAEQAVYLFKLDETLQRADAGVTSVSIDGISISLDNEVDRTLAPAIKLRYGISSTKRRRVGRYVTALSDTYRTGHPFPRVHR